MARTQEQAGELAYRYFQPANGSVDCYVGCVGSKFAEIMCMNDNALMTRKEEQRGGTNPNGTGLNLPVEFSPNGG